MNFLVQFFMFFFFFDSIGGGLKHTLLKFNMEPENGWVSKFGIS